MSARHAGRMEQAQNAVALLRQLDPAARLRSQGDNPVTPPRRLCQIRGGLAKGGPAGVIDRRRVRRRPDGPGDRRYRETPRHRVGVPRIKGLAPVGDPRPWQEEETSVPLSGWGANPLTVVSSVLRNLPTTAAFRSWRSPTDY